MLAILVACFVLSGATSLVLQVVWVRQLIDVFGSSSLAISTVLSTFMAGLAFGAWLGGKWADRLQRPEPAGAPTPSWTRALTSDPLFYYAACEATIAVCALAIPSLIGTYRGANAWLWAGLGDTPWLLAMARFGLAGAALLIPTSCMGATLPLLSRKITQSEDDLGALGRRLGALYAANTVGAVIGASAAGFWMIPLWGVRHTNAVAAFTALALARAIVAALVARRARARPVSNPQSSPIPEEGWPTTGATEAETPATDDPTPPLPRALSGFDRKLVLAAYAISGGVALALEVLWSRTLAMVIGSSVYSFTLVLVVFLIGIAGGAALIARPAARMRDPLATLAALFGAIALTIIATHQLADQLPALFVAMIEDTSLDVSTVLAMHTGLTGLMILPTSLCLGAIMPVAMRAYAGNLEAVGRDVGRAYAANTVGAIIGAFAGGFVILPFIGLEYGILGAALVDAALAVVLAMRSQTAHRRALAMVAGGVLIAALVLPGWNKSVLTAGVFRLSTARAFVRHGSIDEHRLLFYQDGISTTVTVEQRRGRPLLKMNGKVEASTVHDMPTQIMIALLPVFLHGGDEQDVFVVGYGSGITVGALTQAPEVKRVDVVEIEPEVYTAADRFFSAYNHRAQENPKVHRYVGDGRNFLLAGKRKYDVIVSEPSNPWIAGIASLFTREFYHFARAHLSDRGVFCQWAQLYELGPRNVKMIYKTFADAFPYVYAFTPAAHSSDTILIGAMHPIQLDLAAIIERAQVPSIAAELERARISSPEDILANLLLRPDELRAFTVGAEINTDDNALLEYSAPRDLLSSLAERSPLRVASMIHADAWPYGRLEGLVRGLGTDATLAKRALAIARARLEHGRRREIPYWLARARTVPDARADADDLELLADLAAVRAIADPELSVTAGGGPPVPQPTAELFAPRGEIAADDAAQMLRDGYHLLAQGRWSDAWEVLGDLPRRADTEAGRDVSLIMGYIAYKALRFRWARDLLGPLLRAEGYAARRPATVYYAGRTAYGAGHFRAGLAYLDTFAEQHRDLAREVTGRPPVAPPAPGAPPSPAQPLPAPGQP